MAKLRLLLFLSTLLIVGGVGTVAYLYAKGYRINPKNGHVTASGIFVAKSYPDGAQIIINGTVKTATNATMSLPPTSYDITIKKEGYIEWQKRLTIEKETVTEVTAHLFKYAPSLSAITFTGVIKPTPSKDLTKFAYIVPSNSNNQENEGLWVVETIPLPVGFYRDPRRVTDGTLNDATFNWSPDGRQILLETGKATYIVDTGTFTPQSKLINIAAVKDTTLKKWQADSTKRLNSQIAKLPEEMQDILGSRSQAVVFSPDEDMVLYTASASAQIPDNLIKQLPGSSTQKQERGIKKGNSYVYDIKEDRNFEITTAQTSLLGFQNYSQLLTPATQSAILKLRKPSPTPTDSPAILQANSTLSWYPSSRNIVMVQEGKVIIMDYDGTNRATIYSGAYTAPYAFPTVSLDRLLILTNFGATDSPANLYSLGIK